MFRLQPILQLTCHARIDITCIFFVIYIALSVVESVLGGNFRSSVSFICFSLVFLEARHPKAQGLGFRV